MTDDSARGRFTWHELRTPNPNGARHFYTTTLGWKAEPREADASRSEFAASSGPLAGCDAQSPNAVPRWIPFVTVPSVDDTLRDATSRGAKVVVEATALESGGRYAVLVDPQGATIGVYSGEDSGPERDPGPGEFSWHELATTDYRAAFDFYRELFGWENVSEHDMGPMGVYLIFGHGGKQIGGIFNKDSKSGEASWLSYVRVEDLPGTVDRIKAERGSVLSGPMEVPGGDWVAQLLDPYGAAFAVHAVAADVKPEQSRADVANAEDAQSSGASAAVAEAGAADVRAATARSGSAAKARRDSAAKARRDSAAEAKPGRVTTAEAKPGRVTTTEAKPGRGAAEAKAARGAADRGSDEAKAPASKKKTSKTSKAAGKKKKAGAKTKPVAKKAGGKKKAAKKKTGNKKASKKKKATSKKAAKRSAGGKKSATRKAGAKKVGKKSGKKAAKKAAKKAGKKTGKKAGKRTAKKAGKKKSTRGGSAKAGKKAGKKPSKRSAGGSAGKKKAGKKARKKARRR